MSARLNSVVVVLLLIALSLVLTNRLLAKDRPYGPTWNSLSTYNIPEWFKDAKFGMFIHWGLYAIPAGTWKSSVHDEGYSEWIMFHEKIPVKEYEVLAKKFNPVDFDADHIVKIAKKAGMRYLIITAKHHDGFSMFESKISDYNIVDRTPFKRDVIKELSQACRKHEIKFGCYYSTDRDWHHPDCGSNEHEQDNHWDYPDLDKKDFNRYYNEFALPQIKELLVNYKLDIIWFDGIGMKSDEQIAELYRMIRHYQPNCIVNSRIKTWNIEEVVPLKNCDYLSMDDNDISDDTRDYCWENPGTMNTSYGYNKNDHNWLSTHKMICLLVDIVSKGGNYLLNVGLTDKGVIPEISVARLKEIGKWLEVNGEAIYGTTTWKQFGEGPVFELFKNRNAQHEDEDDEGPDYSGKDVRFTVKNNALYAIALGWPGKELVIRALRRWAPQEDDEKGEIKSITMLGDGKELEWEFSKKGLVIKTPKEKPCEHAFVFKITRNFNVNEPE